MRAEGISSACLSRLTFIGLIVVYAAVVSPIVLANNVPWSAIPFNTQSIPLHVKNPCNSMWAPQAFGPAQVSSAWPRLWDTGLEVRAFIFRIDPAYWLSLRKDKNLVCSCAGGRHSLWNNRRRQQLAECKPDFRDSYTYSFILSTQCRACHRQYDISQPSRGICFFISYIATGDWLHKLAERPCEDV